MRKTTLSLTISLILFGASIPVFAEDDLPPGSEPPPPPSEPISPPEGEEPPPPPDGDYLPPHDGELPPPDGEYPPPPPYDGELPPPEGDYPPPHDGELPPPGGDYPPPPPPNFDDFGLNPEDFKHFDAHDIGNVNPEAFAAFEHTNFADLPPEAMNGFTPEQFEHFERDALAGISEDQFRELPPEVLANVDPEKMGGFKPDVFHEFRPEHFQHFNSDQTQQADPRDVFRMIANSDPEHIKPEHVRHLLPPGWEMDDGGHVELPEGERFALPPIPKPSDLPPTVVLPDEIPDLDKGLGLGGSGEPLIDGLNEAMARANLPQFAIRQDDNGIMQIRGSAEFDGIDLAFMPDVDNMKQGGEGAVPGVSQDERGLFVLTTPDGQTIPIRPVPKDIGAIKNLLPGDGGEVKLGKDGDVFVNIPKHDGQPPRCDVGIFDPVIRPAPEGLQPGIHFPDDPSGLEPATIVYEDGTSQTMNPTVPSPEDFIEEARKFAGVDNTQYNGDGTIGLTFQGQPIILQPTFNIEMEPLPDNIEKVEPSITVGEGGIVVYRYQQGDQIAIFTVNIVVP